MVLFSDGGMTTETDMGGVTRYAFDGVRIFKIRVESFPRHLTNMYLILDGEATLVDVAFNSEKGRFDLERGFGVINREFRESVGLADVANIVITHGHGDHFGMLEYDRLKGKRVYVHPLDSPIIMDYHREYLGWKQSMRELAREAGCQIDVRSLFPTEHLLYEPTDYEVVEVTDGQQIIDGYEVHHTPGHSPGEICLQVGPILFLGDHMLSLTTPHQVPRSSWQGVGLETYIDSLRKVANLGAELGLPGHEETIYSVGRRAEEIEAFHYARLEEISGLCREEKNLWQLTCDYYECHPEFIQASSVEDLVVGDKLLALEEIKAHVDYLVDKGRMVVETDSEVAIYRTR